MKSLNDYITEQQLNESFKDFAKNIYDIVTGKKRAEKKRIKEAELAERKVELEKWRDQFFELVKNGTKKNDVLSITYKYTDFTKKYWSDFANWAGPKLLVLCNDNTLKNAQDSYEATEYWGYLNGTNDDEKLKNGFKVTFEPFFKDKKLSAISYRNGHREQSTLIYLFDCVDMKINDPKDIDEMIDILKSPRDFAGGDVDNLIKELESKKNN